MTLPEQALQSGLVFTNGNNDKVPQWNENDWPPLLGGWRVFHASVVLNHSEKDNAQTVVVLGGYQNKDATNSVLVLNLDEGNKRWQEAAPMNQTRQEHAAVVCNGGVYVIGGWRERSSLRTIERIDVRALSQASRTNMNSNHWTTLNCRLTTSRCGCSAVAVGNRYIVIVGGYNGSHCLSSVDIVDTALQNYHTVITGPSMTVARAWCASTVVGHRIFVVGGRRAGSTRLTSSESLEFQQPSNNDTNETDTSTVFPSSSAWKRNSDLVLSVARSNHAAVRVGSCIVVAGSNDGSSKFVEVLDTERNIVWNLPHLIRGRNRSTMVAVSDGIAVIGGEGVDTCETLSLIDRKAHLKSMYSGRAALDAEMEKLLLAIELAKVEYRDEEVLYQGAKAQSLLPLLESLYEDEKFFSVEDFEKKIDELTVRMESMDVIQERIPLVQEVKRLTALVEQNGVILEDKKLPGNKGGSVQISESCVPCAGVFYEKLVDPEDIDVQLHELSFLVSNLNQLKVFYSYLNHLRRSKSLHDEDWQRYSSIALHQTSRKMSVSDSASIEMFERIVSHFRNDGIFVNENIMRSIGINSTSSIQDTMLDLSEFRVGQILPMVTPQTLKTATGYPVLMHVQALGRSLKELLSASEARDENHVVVAVICSILNALSFGGPATLHSSSKPSSVNTVLDQIVDYGDVDHVCSVVDQSGNELLQQVCSEGHDIVDRARTAERNHAKSEEGKHGTHQFLVSVMGLLANGVTKLMRENTRLRTDGESENHEIVTILALIVTAKVIQIAEPAATLAGAREECIDSTQADVSQALPSLCSPLTVIPTSGSVESFRGGKAATLLEGTSALVESVKEIKSDNMSNKHVIELLISQEKAHTKVVEMMEKLDNRQSKLEEYLGYHG